MQACPQQEEKRADNQSSIPHSQIHRTPASGCEEAADADGTPLSGSSVLSLSAPVEAAGASTTNGSVHPCYKWSGEVVLARGKKDIREENSEEEEKEEDGEVCRKEAMKVLCNVIYNSAKAQERASALR